MRDDRCSVTAAGFVAIALVASACSGTSAAPTSSPALVAVAPAANAVIPQNDPASGCSLMSGADASRGLGFQVRYRWTSTTPGVTGYELVATRSGADLPSIDVVVTTTDYTDTECNSYVSDGFLKSWQWRVRVKDAQGQFGDWSAWIEFEFAPCRLSDGTVCHSPQ